MTNRWLGKVLMRAKIVKKFLVHDQKFLIASYFGFYQMHFTENFEYELLPKHKNSLRLFQLTLNWYKYVVSVIPRAYEGNVKTFHHSIKQGYVYMQYILTSHAQPATNQGLFFVYNVAQIPSSRPRIRLISNHPEAISIPEILIAFLFHCDMNS